MTRLCPGLSYPLPCGFLPLCLLCGLLSLPLGGGGFLKIYFLERGRGKGRGDRLKLTALSVEPVAGLDLRTLRNQESVA